MTIQRAIDGKSARGAAKTTYQDWITVWAAIEPLTARELYAADQVQSSATVRIRIRRREGITAKMRVVHRWGQGSPRNENVYDIAGPPIEPLTDRTQLHLMCEFRDAEGFRSTNGDNVTP